MLVKESFDLAIVANSGAIYILLLNALCRITGSVSTASTVKHRDSF